jgi:hypothetical protein
MKMATCRRDWKLHVGSEQQRGLWSHMAYTKFWHAGGLKALAWYPAENYGLRGAL